MNRCQNFRHAVTALRCRAAYCSAVASRRSVARGAEMAAIVQKHDCEGMPESVWVRVGNADALGNTVHQLTQPVTRQVSAFQAHKQ